MSLPRRRDVLASAGASASALAGCLDLGLGGSTDGDADAVVALETVADGFAAPAAVAFRPGDDRPYVVDQPGRAYRVDDDAPTAVADLRDRMVSIGSGYTEQGFLGLAFHPDGDRAYVRYSAPRRRGTPEGYSHTFVLDEVPVTGDGALAVDDERTLLEIPQPQGNHNAGDLAFGPDGHLYVAVGDGGGGGDTGTGHVEDWYDGNAGGNGQDVTENLLGSILRIDVDARSDGKPYGIPDDNPLVDRDGRPEQYAWGLRNPWRLSFDDDRLVVADVGQNRWEEVNVVERGGNYGWNVREGRHCYGAEDCPTATPDGDPLRDPVLEYSHDVGIAVVGGYVYRGTDVPALQGRYVFADWRQRLFVADPSGDAWTREDLAVAPGGGFDRFVLAFGEDHDGELYVATDGDSGPGGESGRLSKFAPADAADRDPTGTTASLTDALTSTVADTPTPPTTDDEPGDDAGQGSDGTPGFGALAAVAALAGTAARRLNRH
ncbi:PQQ-dependent sugar dehydrogenase [Halorubellus sp. PRR65]|uniref:PQQ-dependent sugar dehydrogenase n=1 Tax=Halorubellus sp. PRR65 TaxID=3098148 RepID=UPI002B258D10|nr:PQQ-dependent sugar dehydrogenase [Halorubellus sp. PRR65]